MDLIVQPDGSVRCVYSEELELHEIGRLTIARASHVEPTEDGRWMADLGPVNGPVLGPFHHRSDALDAESQWLSANWLSSPA